jgi:hypothetical protein
LWNGNDPILKERAFGLTGEQDNHGEDVKEYWWYLDALPSHAWNRWRYHYPQRAFPYDDLVAVNGRRDRTFALAGRRPGPAAASPGPRGRPQQPVAQLRRLRHHVDAGQVGVSLVRRLGPGIPLRGPGPR